MLEKTYQPGEIEDRIYRAWEDARAFESAYLSGRLAIAGDISVMARLEVNEGR